MTTGTAPFRAVPDAGDTLVEIVVALAILGVTAVAVMGAMTSTNVGAGVAAGLAGSETAIRKAAEQTLLAETYVPCTTSTSPTYTFSPPAGYSASAVGVKYWDGTFGGGSYVSACPTIDRGAQQLTITLTNTTGRTTPQPVSVVLRNPSR